MDGNNYNFGNYNDYIYCKDDNGDNAAAGAGDDDDDDDDDYIIDYIIEPQKSH